MITVSYGSSFDRAFRRRMSADESLKMKFLEKVEIFRRDPFDPQLRTHKLGGHLGGL